MIVGTTVECGVIDCKYRGTDGECIKQYIEIDFHKQDNLHEYAICKDYEQEESE